MGWYRSNSGSSTHPVGQKRANAWGLYDMHGNVLEWCLDWYGDYPSGSVTDPAGSVSGSYRVYRGGSWSINARSCRSAFRHGGTPGFRFSYLGFRLSLASTTEPDHHKELTVSGVAEDAKKLRSNAVLKDYQPRSSEDWEQRGLILHLPFNDSATDVSGADHAVSGSPSRYLLEHIPDSNSQRNPIWSAIFTGKNSVKVSSANDLSPSSYTVCVAIKAYSRGYNSQKGHTWITILRRGTHCPYAIFLDSVTLRIRGSIYDGDAGTGGDAETKNPIRINTWYHVSVTYSPTSNGTISIYLDGVFQTRKTGVGPLPNRGDFISIGGGTFSGISSFFDGQIGDVRLYNRVLTGSEISKLAEKYAK